MGLRELIVVCCLINGIAGRVVENEEIQNKVSGNQNNKVCLNVACKEEYCLVNVIFWYNFDASSRLPGLTRPTHQP